MSPLYPTHQLLSSPPVERHRYKWQATTRVPAHSGPRRMHASDTALLAFQGGEHQTQRAARDARLGPIGGGSDEIMHEILGRLPNARARGVHPFWL
jgi:hypothetical protein